MPRKHKSDLVILFATLVLMAIGLIIIYAIGPMRANVLNATYGANYGANDFFFGQLRSVGLSLVAFFAAFKWIPAKYIKKYAKVILILALAASLLLWLLALAGSSLVKCELGECRWFNFGSLSIQPAEMLKVALVIYLADFFTRKKEEGVVGQIKEFWVPFVLVCGLALFLVVVAQGDLGTGISLGAIILGTLLLSGISAKQYAAVVVMVVVAAVVVIVFSGYRMDRIDAWLTTLTGGEVNDSTYHIYNAILAIGVGGFFGVGIGNSVQATGYLPESINDSVFAIMGETFGFVGLILILAVFAVMLMRMIKVAEHTDDSEERLIVVGVFSWMLAQVAVNIMAMTSIIPVTGVTLPLLSYGGTSMVFIAFALGLVLQISCYTNREVIKHENISSGRGLGGTHHASRRRSERNLEQKTSRRG